MLRWLAILLLCATQASAQSILMGGNTAVGSCACSLDFSQASNSMYAFIPMAGF